MKLLIFILSIFFILNCKGQTQRCYPGAVAKGNTRYGEAISNTNSGTSSTNLPLLIKAPSESFKLSRKYYSEDIVDLDKLITNFCNTDSIMCEPIIVIEKIGRGYMSKVNYRIRKLLKITR